MHLYLVRHGRDAADDTGERMLTAVGRTQAEAVGTWLAGRAPTRLYCSTLTRARETADIVGEAVGLCPVREPGLNEVAGDDQASAGIAPRERRSVPGGLGRESWNGFLERVAACVSELCRDVPTGNCVVLVTHSGFFDAVHELLSGAGTRVEMAVAHTGVTHWQFRYGTAAGNWVLHQHNGTAHLAP
ncbi:histidine phosphatase family protein [Streptomyces sp. NPDC088726]|uniref:histidine phosphatase family protein n=1 Tax=Streptomyces sp. NPDC088726 TaxID=3365874 RepID=UPI0038297B09